MPNRLSKLPLTKYTAAVLSVPGRAAFCITRYEVGPYRGGGSRPASVPSGFNGVGFSALKPTGQYVKTCYPEIKGVAAVPARVDQFDNIGWNSGARSISEVVSAGGYFRCRLPDSPVGVQVGLTGRLMAHNYAAMSHSIVARRDQYTIVERGASVFGPDNLPPGSEIEIRRAADSVIYFVNGAQVYASTAPLSSEAFGAALLYSRTDYVDSPSIGAPISFSGRMPPIAGSVRNTTDAVSSIIGRHPTPRLRSVLDSVGLVSLRASLPQLVALASDSNINVIRGYLPQTGLRAELGLVEEIPTSASFMLPVLTLNSTLVGGQSIAFSANLPSAIAAASDDSSGSVRAEISVQLQTLISEPYLAQDEVDGSDAAFMADDAILETALLLLAMDSIDASSTGASLVLVMELAALDSIMLESAASISRMIELLAMERVAILGRSSAAKQQAIQYAVNYATGALTTYRDFDFKGFTCNHDDAITYGWRQDGLYRIGASRDSESVIEVLADFGASDFGDPQMKRLSTAFVGVRTDGDCYLRTVEEGGSQRVYKLAGTGSQSRAVLAKGAISRHWGVRLELTSASFASIDSIELEVAVSQRRNFGRRGPA